MNQAGGTNQQKKKQSSKIKAEKLKFINQLRNEMQQSNDQLQKSWFEQLDKFNSQKEKIDDAYDHMQSKIDNILMKLQHDLMQIKSSNADLLDQIEQKKALKASMQSKTENRQIEISAEIDMELKLQQRTAELHQQLGESKRLRDTAIAEEIKLKKGYIRLINQYKQFKLLFEEREAQKQAIQKKKYLQKKKQELEEEQKRKIEAENDPMNRYRSLLAAAGHIKVNDLDGEAIGNDSSLTKLYKKEGPITHIYQPDQYIHQMQQNTGAYIIDSPQNDEGIWLENNIRTLLSTGNYTDDDPVIRNLKAELARIRCMPH